jgi:hypothetical protein
VESESEDESEPEEPPKLPSPSRTSKNLEANRKKALCAIQADFQACNEFSPSSDPGAALAAIDSTLSQLNASVDIAKYLVPEPQSSKAVLRLDDDIRRAWLHAILLEIRNLIDNNTSWELNPTKVNWSYQ